MAESSDGGLTSFPLSHSLPSSPVSAEGDATFSILPRYLLQKVKSTFSSTATSSSHASGSNASSVAGDAATASTSKPSSSRQNSTGTSDAIQPMHHKLATKKSAEIGPRIHPINTRAQSPSLRDSSIASRNPRLTTLSGQRRAVAPVLSKTVSESGNFASFQHNGSVSLSRSHSRSLGTLPESPTENSPPPPPYSFNANYPFSSIPGFPLNRDPNEDAKSVSSIAGPSLGVAQIFRRLRGEALSRDYWMSDESAVDCYDCNTTFTAWRRKHHCRVCGRIFCSRCASNIIPGARFGHEGLVRVCNLCLAILKHEVERGAPRNSVAPPEDTSFGDRPGLTSSGSVANLNISLPLESSFRAPQSQFSASVLFPRNDFSSYNLAANLSSEDLSQLNNSKRGRRFSDASLARPETPDMFEESASPTPWHPTLGSPFTAGFRDSLNTSIGAASPAFHATTPAPFRKTAADEDKALPSPQPNHSSSDASPLSSFVPPSHDSLPTGGLGIFSPTIPAVLEPSLTNIAGSVHFESSYENSLAGGPTTSSGTGRPETPSAASYLPASMVVPHIRSRMNSRAADQVFDLADIDTRRLSEVNYLPQLFRTQSRSMSFVNDVELAAAALAHVRRLLIQCLNQAQIPKAHIWEEELLRILVKVATYPLPKVKEGDSMDVRRYIKIKRVPGGTPADSEYVDGIVFTKSMLNKSLPTFISHPRIMVFNYAFEFEHDETKMARLDTLRDSEKDSLRKLANSIIDHRPHVVLVGKNVSGLALDYLHKANIVVARNVKPSVLEIVARCTRAGIFNTYQHFPETTRLGRCQVFRSDTIVHNLIPGRRKTLMRFEGCSRDLGGTVILRGGDVATLTKIKRIMNFMVLAVYSARLEMCLFWDEHAAIPPAIELSRLREAREDDHTLESDISYFSGREPEDQPPDDQKETDKLIKRALKPYTSTILSTSPTIIFPPPHSLERLRIDNDRIEELRTHHKQERTITHGSELQPQQAQQSQSSQESFAAPVTVSKGGEPEAALQTSAALTRSLSEVSLLSVKPQTKTKVLKISAELAEASQIAEAQKKRDEHLAIWEKRLARHQDDLDPAVHQHLSILETVICATTLKACDGPRLVRRYFYNKSSDLTLRQYVERTVLASSHRCPAKGCEKPMLAHYTTYAHGEQRLHMVLESYPFVRQNPEDILLWSYCKICSTTTDVTSLSDEASNYSFAKYLEVSFHHGQLYCRELSCPHNIHRDHFRYFAYRNMAIRIWVDPIDVSDVSIPPLQIRIDPWTQLRVKNDEYRELQKIVTSYWDSVIARIKAFNYELLPADRAEAGRTAMHSLAEAATADRQTFMKMLDKAYEDAEVNKPSSMNVVRHALMKKISTWDNDFISFEQKYIPSDAERARRMTSTHLRRLFSDPNSSVPNSPDLRGGFSPMPSVPSSPLYGTGGFGDTTYIPGSLAGLAGLGLTPSEAGSITPSSVSETSSNGESAVRPVSRGESASSSRLTAANLAKIVEDAFNEQPTDLDSIVDHGESQPSTSVVKSEQREGSDSDTTVCAEPMVNRRAIEDFDSMRSESEDIDTGLAMRPYKVRKAKAVPSIANLVQRFETPETSQPEGSRLRISILPMSSNHRASIDATHKSPNRPGLRRGKSDYTEIKNTKAKQAKDERNQVLSDGDAPVPASAPATSTMANRASRLPRSPRTRPASPVTSKRRPTLESRTSSSSQVSSRPEAGTSQRPSMLTRTSTMSSRTTVAGSGIRKRTQEQGVTSDSANDEGRKSSTLKLPSRDSKSTSPTAASGGLAVKVPRRTPSSSGPGPNSRVTTMARHFNQLSRDAERERQRQLLLARRKTARPVLVPRATANFFVSSKEALKDDSDDDGSSSGADDEMGPGDEEDADPPKAATPQPIALKGASSPAVERPFRYELNSEVRPGALSASSTSSDISLQASESTSNTDPTNPGSTGPATDSGPSVPPSPQVSGTLSAVPRLSHLSESEMSSTGTETRSLMKTLSNLWNYRGADFIPLEYPNMGVEHLVEGSNIVMREDEPSSIIAQGLNSPAYKAALREGMPASVASSAEAFMPDQPLGHGINRASNWDVLDFQTDPGTDLEEAMKKPANQIMRVVWDGEHVRCTMKVFFAHQFDALRKNCDIEELFIESLARCVKWDAVGGKSGSAFLKTRDDRFIIKEISPVEMNALIHFAPKYFEYMSRAFFHDLPTVMAKILGVYRLSVKNIQTGKVQKMDVLVMENIYYGKTITRQYDLKGSLRNRHVEVSDSKTCVLLDENLIEMAYDRPLYVREHTKKHLETALYNDSLFLSNNKVMDYSLIVGVDKDSLELVVGIIDFLRPYTWDKRLETWVKETAYMGGGHREPTILNPRIYKTRFREAMSRYFVLVPDAWTSAEAIETGQPLPNTAPTTSTKDKSKQGHATEEQPEQYAGGSSRAHSPATLRKLVPLVNGGR